MGQSIGFMRKVVCFPIKLYQYALSPCFKPCCRFYPSCSQYALQSIEHHGISKGIWFAVRRILRCHPWSVGGYDPVFPNHEEKH
jgi:putative membrane protein insertion efficiency factor